MADARLPARERVEDRDVGCAVVGEHALDLDPVAGEEDERAVEEADRGRRLLVGEYFRVGEAAVVVDGDVDELATDRAPVAAGRVAAAWPLAARPAAANPFPGATFDPASFLTSMCTSSPGRERS